KAAMIANGTVSGQASPVAAGDDAQAAVVDCGVGHGNPDCQHFGFVSFGAGDTLILMPGSLSGQTAGLDVLSDYRFGRLDAHVLDRVAVNFWPDEHFDIIQQFGVTQKVKDRFTQVDGRIFGDRAVCQSDVEVAVHFFVSMADYRSEALVEG